VVQWTVTTETINLLLAGEGKGSGIIVFSANARFFLNHPLQWGNSALV
jgi:hypothetical protein